uniref:Uncharacterized protein n=1 Tax=Panagrolaimus sp. ES5 TaxID=591445 RepID=A0AC34G902_9BILA
MTDIDVWQKANDASQKTIEKLKTKRNEVHNIKRQHERHKVKHSDEIEQMIEEQIGESGEHEYVIEEYKHKLEQAKQSTIENSEAIKTLQDENKALKTRLQQYEKPQSEILEIFKSGRYIDKVVFAIAQLKKCHVSDKNCGEVIKICLAIVNLIPNKLPSRKTVARFNFVAKAFINAQLREYFLSAARRGVPGTLGTDESTKNGHKIQTFQYRMVHENGNILDLCIGMPEVTDKSAVACMKALEHSVKQLETDSMEGNVWWNSFMLTVGNTMSDQAATEIKKNNLFEAAKKVIIDGDARWAHLNEKERCDLAKIKTYFCQLHIIHNTTPVILSAKK